MERTLRLLDSEARRRGRKRRKSVSPPPSTSASSIDTAPPPEEAKADEVELDGEVLSAQLQRRLKEAVHSVALDRRRGDVFAGNSSAAFAARTAVGAWLAAQAARPVKFGIAWAAQLYICFFLVTGAYSNGPETFEHFEMLRVEDMIALCMELGRAGSGPDDADHRMMLAARQWSRAERGSTVAAMLKASKHMRDEKRVRLAVEGVLFNAHRAKTLFT